MHRAASDVNQGLPFLLSQVGFQTAVRFAEAISALGLLPAHAGILQLVSRLPGQSQQALANKLGIPANRLVGLLDELEERGLLRRERRPTDRRVFAVSLTGEGERMVAQVAEIGARHEAGLVAAAGFSDAERDALRAQLLRLAEAEGLEPGVHPGLRKLR